MWKVVKTNEEYHDESTFANLGNETIPSEELKKQLQNFVCLLCGYKDTQKRILFGLKSSKVR